MKQRGIIINKDGKVIKVGEYKNLPSKTKEEFLAICKDADGFEAKFMCLGASSSINYTMLQKAREILDEYLSETGGKYKIKKDSSYITITEKKILSGHSENEVRDSFMDWANSHRVQQTANQQTANQQTATQQTANQQTANQQTTNQQTAAQQTTTQTTLPPGQGYKEFENINDRYKEIFGF